MCDETFHIKLCTCDTDQMDMKDYWTLRRGDSGLYCVGKIVIRNDDRFSPEDYLKMQIMRDLNNHDVFDFDYKYERDMDDLGEFPERADFLTIKIENYTFTYMNWGHGFCSPEFGQPDEPPYRKGSVSRQNGR